MGNVLQKIWGWVKWPVSFLLVAGLVFGEIETGFGRKTAERAKEYWNAPPLAYPPDVLADVLLSSVSLRCSHDDLGDPTSGSGVLFHRWGRTYVITAAHVINCELESTNFTFYACLGTNEWKLKLVSFSKDQDLALLRVDPSKVVGRSVRWYDPKGPTPGLGVRVLHVGNLFGALSHSISDGMISGIDRKITKFSGGYWDQSTVTIYGGSSGGGVWTSDGRCIGIVTLMRNPQVCLYVPIRRVYAWAQENDLLFLFD